MTARLWFYERLILGRWSPVTQPNRPDTKTIGGRKRLVGVNGVRSEIRNLQDVPEYLHHLSLDQLAELYGQGGRLQATGVA